MKVITRLPNGPYQPSDDPIYLAAPSRSGWFWWSIVLGGIAVGSMAFGFVLVSVW